MRSYITMVVMDNILELLANLIASFAFGNDVETTLCHPYSYVHTYIHTCIRSYSRVVALNKCMNSAGEHVRS